MAQDTPKDNAGFTLPPPAAEPATPATPATAVPATSASVETAPALDQVGATDTSSRDTLIGGAVLLVLFVAFFFAKNAYANGLVAKRVSPNKANASGWWLFIFLASLATAVVLAAVNSHKFLAPLFMGPLVLVGLVALVLTFTSSKN
jgi:membrane-associated HD superfamily phosphohydrolase